LEIPQLRQKGGCEFVKTPRGAWRSVSDDVSYVEVSPARVAFLLCPMPLHAWTKYPQCLLSPSRSSPFHRRNPSVEAHNSPPFFFPFPGFFPRLPFFFLPTVDDLLFTPHTRPIGGVCNSFPITCAAPIGVFFCSVSGSELLGAALSLRTVSSAKLQLLPLFRVTFPGLLAFSFPGQPRVCFASLDVRDLTRRNDLDPALLWQFKVRTPTTPVVYSASFPPPCAWVTHILDFRCSPGEEPKTFLPVWVCVPQLVHFSMKGSVPRGDFC